MGRAGGLRGEKNKVMVFRLFACASGLSHSGEPDRFSTVYRRFVFLIAVARNRPTLPTPNQRSRNLSGASELRCDGRNLCRAIGLGRRHTCTRTAHVHLFIEDGRSHHLLRRRGARRPRRQGELRRLQGGLRRARARHRLGLSRLPPGRCRRPRALVRLSPRAKPRNGAAANREEASGRVSIESRGRAPRGRVAVALERASPVPIRPSFSRHPNAFSFACASTEPLDREAAPPSSLESRAPRPGEPPFASTAPPTPRPLADRSHFPPRPSLSPFPPLAPPPREMKSASRLAGSRIPPSRPRTSTAPSPATSASTPSASARTPPGLSTTRRPRR